ncbi:MAG: hypothetical protein ABR540_15270 [Acidimicrobiales bacterium]
MGFILSGVVMHLVNVVRTLRDAGRDVQASLNATPYKLRKPWTSQLTPHVMMMDFTAEIAAFVGGIVAAVSIGGVDRASIANPALASRADLADLGVARAAAAWLPGLRFAGLAILLERGCARASHDPEDAAVPGRPYHRDRRPDESGLPGSHPRRPRRA